MHCVLNAFSPLTLIITLSVVIIIILSVMIFSALITEDLAQTGITLRIVFVHALYNHTIMYSLQRVSLRSNHLLGYLGDSKGPKYGLCLSYALRVFLSLLSSPLAQHQVGLWRRHRVSLLPALASLPSFPFDIGISFPLSNCKSPSLLF